MLPEGTLQDRVAIITGGGTGLGKAMSQEFSRLGARVVLASRNEDNLKRTAAEIEAQGGQALAVPVDVRNPDQVDRMVQAALDRFGRIDILVNNAAGNFVCPAEDLSVNGWNAVVNIVLHGTFYCTRAVARHWIDQGRGGSILNILATYAWTGGPGTVHSAAAKAGVLAMTRTLAVEWASKGIRVNAIAPGPVDGTGAAPQLWPTEEARQVVLESIPLGRMGRPDAIAQAAAYLVADYAGCINREVLTIDGGQWLGRGVFQGARR